MKNLKKVLALALAFACAFTMFAGAAFTDADEINDVNTDAVNSLVSLGVIDGYAEDNTFRPDKTVKRAEMAKMIYVLRTGKSDASAYNDDKTSFTDITDHWARGYIKYCQALGIIAGQSYNTFNPEAAVTTTEAAKMLLVTLGYDQEKAGLVGSSWSAKTLALADENNLLEDVTCSLSGPCPRQYAAQIIWNTVNAPTVEYRNDEYTKYNAIGNENNTVGVKYMDLKESIGVLSTSGHAALTGTGSDEGLTIIDVPATPPTTGTTTVTFTKVTEDYSALLGQRVKVLYKDTDEVYGVSAVKENKLVMNVKASDLDKSTGETKIKVDGTKYTLASDVQAYVAGGTTSNNFVTGDLYNSSSPPALDATKIATWVDGIKKSDFDVTVISNDDDNNIDVIIVYQKIFGKITSLNSDTIYWQQYTNGAATTAYDIDIEEDEPETYEGMAKNDYVFVSRNYYADVPVIEKAEKITGKTDATRTDEIRVDGTWYNFRANAGATGAGVNKDVDLYVYGTYAYLVEGAGASDVDVLLVKSVGDYRTLDKGGEAKVLMEDGTEKTINVVATATGVTKTLISNETAWKTGPLIKENTLYEYDEDDGDYTLQVINSNSSSYSKIGESAANFTSFTGKSWNKDKETINGTSVDDDAVIFMKYNSADEDKYRVIKASSLGTYKSLTGKVSGLSENSGDVVAAFLDYDDKYASSGDELYAVVTGTSTQQNSDSKNVVFFDIITEDGEHEEVESNETDESDYAKGDIIKFNGSYEMMEDVVVLENEYKPTREVDEWQGYAAVDEVSNSGKLVRFKNLYSSSSAQPAYSSTLEDDTVVIGVNMKNDDYVSVGKIDPMEAKQVPSSSPADYYANVFAKADEDGKLELLVIDNNNQIKKAEKDVVMYNAAKVVAPSIAAGSNCKAAAVSDPNYDYTFTTAIANVGTLDFTYTKDVTTATGTSEYAIKKLSGTGTYTGITGSSGSWTITNSSPTAGDVFEITITDKDGTGEFTHITKIKVTVTAT